MVERLVFRDGCCFRLIPGLSCGLGLDIGWSADLGLVDYGPLQGSRLCGLDVDRKEVDGVSALEGCCEVDVPESYHGHVWSVQFGQPLCGCSSL